MEWVSLDLIFPLEQSVDEELSEDYGKLVDPRMHTSLSGIFGARDFITHGNKVCLIASAFTDAILAANSAKMYLDPAAFNMAGVPN
ncbi:hypothetical protein H1230_19025 [Paenibacillus sp. 19GGS1-52]|uniref:hypothetical protein n=1 Tax=Paenibacillus sp. 19GGS1-52 TaxID=2758563 RepID=UPI001EFB361F|nr:hypothetical protein [Paenibacillus sp. 19GGS1-52]ULO05201.1 hypothetical protein H1230_19025 [Paenibacillus sp. 19GGS1-52]